MNGLIRFGGLATGMDTEQMVRDLMRVQRLPMDKMMQRRQTIEWQMDSYRDVNRKLNEFRNKISDNLILTRANLLAKTVSSSHSNRVTATAAASAGNVTYRINEVRQLATAASTFSTQRISSPDTQLKASDPIFTNQRIAEGDYWKQGVLETTTINATTSRKEFTLADDTVLRSGTEEDWIIKVNGRQYEVVTSLAEGETLGTNQVLVTLGNNNKGAKLEFAQDISTGSSINVTYFSKDKKETLNSATAKTDYTLTKGSLSKEGLVIKVNGTTVPNSKLVFDPEQELADGEVFVDLARGRIKFKDATRGPVEVTYTQNYATAGISTYNATGTEVKESFIIQSGQTMSQIMSRVNNAPVGVSAFYDEFSNQVTMTRKETGISNALGDEIQFHGDFFTKALNLNSYQIALDGDGVINGINQATGASSGFIVKDGSGNIIDGKFKIENGVLLQIEDSTGTAMNARLDNVNVFDSNNRKVGSTTGTGKLNFQGLQGGQNASFTINGLETERRTNTFTIEGVTLTLRETFAATDGSVTLDVTNDTNKVMDTIKKFVEDYNNLLDFVNGLLKEERYRDFKPLTEEQKEAMSEKDIETWEEKARSGLLRNDTVIRSAMDRLRVDIYSAVSSTLETQFKQLSSIGITTSRDYMERGKLEINEDRLRAAIEADAAGVHALFTADGETSNEKGIARRMRDTLDGAMGQIAQRAGGSRGLIQNHQFALGRDLNNLNSQISNFERRLKTIEDRYWKQFSAMEAAVNKANQQAESLFAQLYGNMQ